ncbi:MAG: MBL fold metallo-hydrolase [Fidelibacterota bacterium]|nr:MAG: MBL fold metallo-hydrolase [Candidatus Neomarinimicrobiota bacterium]
MNRSSPSGRLHRKLSRPLWAVLTLFLASCAMFQVQPSALRPPVPKSLSLTNNVVLTSWGAVDMKVLGSSSTFFPGSFLIKSRDMIVYIDPLEVEESPPADFIFITHPHDDHLSLPDIERLAKEGTVIVGPPAVVKRLKDFNTLAVRPGKVIDREGLHVQALPAYNTEPLFLWLLAHPKKALNVGYILTIDSVSICHAGDTSPVPELERIRDITVALIPLDEDNGKLTMDVEQAAALVNSMQPTIAIPMHYEVGKGYPERFKQRIDQRIRVEIME